jgi:transcriptional regulator with XRE-family HTH domain
MKQKIIFYEEVKKRVKQQKPPTTIEAVIEEAGFSKNTYDSYRKQGNLPRADEAVKIAKILGVHVEELVTGNKPVLSEQSIQEKKDMTKILDDLLHDFAETIEKHKEKFKLE